ncbi:Hsp20/alpha crystallin family protein [Actinoplanes sp. NPDC049265]|uniref:Hsp20/alpha crystallin family protein n=1 Tax=Actinoplanes sp. NPDC049265 TaxID=3363902 RepID=UPI00370FA98D
MLMRSEPFTEMHRIAQQVLGLTEAGTWTRPTAMPVDAYRHGDELVIAFDLPGVDRDAIDIDVERDVLTVRAERRPIDLGDNATVQVSERSFGVFARRLFLGDALDTEQINATYDNGVLVLRVPIAEKAKPRKIAVSGRDDAKVLTS